MRAQNFEKPISYTMNTAPEGSSRKPTLEFRTSWIRTGFQTGLEGYSYSFNGRTYRDVDSLWKEPVEELSKYVQITTDIYGEKVLKTYKQIPTFDSGDREWDSKELEFLFFDGRDIHLVVMRGGYRIAKLTFYEKLLAADEEMKLIFERLGWPLPDIRWSRADGCD